MIAKVAFQPSGAYDGIPPEIIAEGFDREFPVRVTLRQS
jgi:hypothetical protein